MKKLLSILASTALSTVAIINSNIVQITRNLINNLDGNSDSWDSYDLSDFSAVQNVKHNWNNVEIENNDLNININSVNANSSESKHDYIFDAIARGLDTKYKDIEKSVYGVSQTTIFHAALTSNELYISALDYAADWSEQIDNPSSLFQSVKNFKPAEINSFDLRISNKFIPLASDYSKQDWVQNKSYFDVSVNICNFGMGIDGYTEIANSAEQENIDFLNRGVTLSDTADTGYHWKHTYNAKLYDTSAGGYKIPLTKISTSFRNMSTMLFFIKSIKEDANVYASQDSKGYGWTLPWSSVSTEISMQDLLKNSYSSEDWKSDSRWWNPDPNQSDSWVAQPYDFYIPNHGSLYYSNEFSASYSHLQGFLFSAYQPNSSSITLMAAFEHLLYGHLWSAYTTYFDYNANSLSILCNQSIFQNNPTN